MIWNKIVLKCDYAYDLYVISHLEALVMYTKPIVLWYASSLGVVTPLYTKVPAVSGIELLFEV